MTTRSILGGVFHGGSPRMLDEGLIVLAWLALWRPAESLIYGSLPEYRKRRLYERLAAIQVSVRTEPAQGEGAHSGPGHLAAQSNAAELGGEAPEGAPGRST
jgi:hypothetical protein